MTSRARLALLTWIAGVLTCVAIVAQTRFTADMSAFLPRAPTAEQRILVDQLKDGALSRMVLIGIEGGDGATRAALSMSVAAKMRSDPAFTSVLNGAGDSAKDRDYLFANRYVLSPAVTPAHFSEAGLRTAIGESIDLLASPAGMMLKSILARDPTGEMVRLAAALDGGAQPAQSHGAWASKDGERAILLARTRAAGSDIDGQQVALDALRAAFAKAQAEAGSAAAGTALLLTGTGVFAVQSRATIQSEVLRLSVLSTLIIVMLLLFIYRSFTALGLGLLPVASGALAAVAAVSLEFGEVHGLTLGFGTTLIGEAVDYSIYLFIQSGRGREPAGTHAADDSMSGGGDGGGDGAFGDAASGAMGKMGERNEMAAGAAASAEREWVRAFWPTVRLGVMTSVCGFAALLASGFPGLAQLGLYSITGLVVAAAVTRFVLPTLLPKRFRVRDVSPLGAQVAIAAQRAGALRWLVALLIAGAAVVLVVRHATIWNNELSGLNPIPLADQARDQRLRADLGAPDARFLLVAPGADADAALEAADRVGAVLDPLVAAGVLAGYENPARFLPAAATQKARQDALPPRDELLARLRAATADLPLRAERLAPFLDAVDAARRRAPLTRADLDGTALAQAVDGLLVRQSDGRWNAFLPLRAPPGAAVDAPRVRAALAAADLARTGTLLVDLKGESDRLYSGYLREGIGLSLAGLGAIVVLLFASLRSLARVLRVLAPLAAAVLVVVAALTLAGRQLTILHLVGLLLIVAVGSNYALFFDRGRTLGDGKDDAGGVGAPRMLASLVCANVTTVAGFGLLAFSSVPVLQAIGLTVGPGAILALVFSAIFASPTHARASAAVRGQR